MGSSNIISTKCYLDFSRPDIRDLSEDYFQEAPIILDAGLDEPSALSILLDALGLNDNIKLKIVSTPLGSVNLNSQFLNHITEKRNDARERYANYIIPTLTKPFEIYHTEYSDGFRYQFIGLFKGKNNLLVVVKIDSSNNIMWNIMHTDKRIMNKHRKGELIFYQK